MIDTTPRLVASRKPDGSFDIQSVGLDAAALFTLAAILTRVGNRMIDAIEAQAAQAARETAKVAADIARERHGRRA